MSEQQQDPGWWQASDGKWYPPPQPPEPRRPKRRARMLLIVGVVLLVVLPIALGLMYWAFGPAEDIEARYYWELLVVFAYQFVLVPAVFVLLIAVWLVWRRSEPAARRPSPAVTGEEAPEPAAGSQPATEGVGCVSSPLPLAAIGFLIVANFAPSLADWPEWTLPGTLLVMGTSLVAVAMAARNLLARRSSGIARLWDALAAVLGAASLAWWVMVVD